jgi:flagellar assembly protein FliH
LSNRFIPSAQLSAVLPWQMGSLDAQRGKRKTGLVDEVAEMAQASAGINQARDEGFRHGLEVGYAKGHATALRQNQQFSQILAGLQGAVAALDETVAAELVELALGLARQVVCTHIDANQDAILPVVREALNGVIAIAQHPRLVMHPDDAEIVQRELATELGAHNCRVAPDARMARSGVRIEDASFEVDATLPTRWKRTLASLGLNDDWLA